MKIVIIGAGISGLTAAYRFWATHDITVFEANDSLGGHTNTVEVEIDGERHAIDTGFIVFNDWTYPNFIARLDELDLRSLPTSMCFSVRCDAVNLETSPSCTPIAESCRSGGEQSRAAGGIEGLADVARRSQ